MSYHFNQTNSNMSDVQEFIKKATEAGFSIVAGDSIVSITKQFTPGDTKAFAECDGQYYWILRLVPVVKSRSSVWGTDGGSVGGWAALESGRFTLNISGVQKKFLAELEKQLKPYEWMR